MAADDMRRIAALMEQSLSERDQDLMTFLKQRFANELKAETTYEPEKVITRSDKKRVSVAKIDDQGKSKCDRRRCLHITGFFSPINKPYRSVGLLHTDNVDLFSSWLTPEELSGLKAQWDKKFGGKKAGNTITSSKFNQEKAKKDESVAQGPVEDMRVGNGVVQLRQYLREMGAIQNTLRSGHPLVLCLWEQDGTLQAKSSSHRVPSADAEALKPVSLCLNEQMDPEDQARQQRANVRNQQNLLEKLEWIHKILCGITHMRSRDLKTVVPLNCAYVNIIMKDTETTNILLRQSNSSNNSTGGVGSRRLVTIVPEESHNLTEVWEQFIQDTPENKNSTARSTGGKSQYARKKMGLDSDTTDQPPWLCIQLEENSTSKEKNKPQRPKDQGSMLEKAKTEFLGIRKSLDYQIETDVFEKKKNREERMKTLLNAFMASKTGPILSTVLVSLKSEFKEPKTTGSFWFDKLRNDAAKLGEDKQLMFNDILEKISQFQKFNVKKVAYAKEKFCLLVISIPANQLLRPALQEALLFLANHVLQVLPRQVRQWYQYLKLPFSASMDSLK
ncbi:uncharacterized protein LOC134455879 isoform X2 [Engraulis encrasicolus]|uniref:uncharacterized protein LOC134455879 isoform X2 n=1 Tax=Engraulis encrasicolus TaxID=184585 RepID=UPI002FD13E81